jgi:hypothetical protein
MPEQIFIERGIYVMTPELVSMASFINPSHQSVRPKAYVSSQLLGKNVTTATNTQQQ